MQFRIKDSFMARIPAAKTLYRRAIAEVPSRLRLGKGFWKWYALFQVSERWPRDEIEEFQTYQIVSILDVLRDTHPYYKGALARFDSHGMNLGGFREQFPLTGRDDFRTINRQVCRFRGTKLEKCSTSGTTGNALQFYHLRTDSEREWAALCYQWKRVGFDPVSSRRAEFRGLVTAREGVEYFPHKNMVRFSILDFNRRRVEKYAEEIARAGLNYYHGYPSAMFLLSKAIQESGVLFPQPAGILLASEQVFEWQLQLIRAVFPASKIFAHYGCAERTVLAGWCENSENYHILDPYSFVEVDNDTQQIVGTNLVNFVNPFLRYKMSDTVEIVSQGSCPACGRASSYLVKILGREEDFVFSYEHGWIPPAVVTYPLKGLTGIREVQIHQQSKTALVVKYTVRPGSTQASITNDTERLSRGLKAIIGDRIVIQPERVEEFQRGVGGKFKWIVNDIGLHEENIC